jgi:AraC family transcriptional regulator of adaptative response / DNA-3-methyladenine glycosylase II
VLGRLALTFGDPVTADDRDSLTRLFPAAARIATVTPRELVDLGLTQARSRALVGLAAALAAGTIRLEPEGDVDAAVEALLRLPGIGAWTANYIAMRALRWPDAFLAGDLVVLKAMNEAQPARALRRSEAWRPWRAYAVMHLWRNAQ